MNDDKPKVMALKIYPGGRVERRFADPLWLEIDMMDAAEKVNAGASVWIDPEDLPAFIEQLSEDED